MLYTRTRFKTEAKGNSETAYRLHCSTRRSHQSTAHAVELFNKNLVEAILQTNTKSYGRTSPLRLSIKPISYQYNRGLS